MTLPMVTGAPMPPGAVPWTQPTLLWAALLTVLIETPLFYLCGYRRREEYLWFAAANLMSNLLLNEALSEIDGHLYAACAVLGETLAVALEFALASYVARENHARLFRVLLLTNAASLCAGFLWAALA